MIMCIWALVYPALLNSNTASMQESNINLKCQNVIMKITKAMESTAVWQASMLHASVCTEVHFKVWKEILGWHREKIPL